MKTCALVFVTVTAAATACSSPPKLHSDAGVPADYTIDLLTARIGSDPNGANFQKATASVAPLAAPAATVKLAVDLSSTCFPFEAWATDPPPSGQSWPADCDAFDRNFEMLLGAESGAARVELIRAITPFGGPLHVEADVTDVWNALAGNATFEIDIPTYSDGTGKVSGSNGGWNVTAHITVSPGAPPRHVLAVLPILDGSATASATSQTLPFTLPAGTTATRIEYRATGHGQGTQDSDCIGPADEFCTRTHTMTIDGQMLATPMPWRDDCDTLCTSATFAGSATVKSFDYCAENPCGAMASVTAPRANWCPGSATPPIVFTPTLSAGDHTFG